MTNNSAKAPVTHTMRSPYLAATATWGGRPFHLGEGLILMWPKSQKPV